MKALRRLGTCRVLLSCFLAVLSPGLGSCEGDEGEQGPKGDPGDPGGTETELSRTEDPPGIVVEILELKGASGGDGTFQVGNRIKVKFSAKKNDGTDWDLAEFSSGRVLVSGPTFNYQRVLAEQSDVRAESVKNSDGTYTYTFDDPIPATYLAPINDTPSFGPLDGELSGQPLVAGTYTLGLSFRWDYTVEGQGFRDQGEDMQDMLFLGADTLVAREAVLTE